MRKHIYTKQTSGDVIFSSSCWTQSMFSGFKSACTRRISCIAKVYKEKSKICQTNALNHQKTTNLRWDAHRYRYMHGVAVNIPGLYRYIKGVFLLRDKNNAKGSLNTYLQHAPRLASLCFALHWCKGDGNCLQIEYLPRLVQAPRVPAKTVAPQSQPLNVPGIKTMLPRHGDCE